MLFRHEFLQKIKKGQVKVAYRRWTKLTVKVGGELKTAVGVLKFNKIIPVDEKKLNLKDAKLAGYPDLASLHKDLSFKKEGTVYKISFKLIGEDPRLKLREDIDLEKEEIHAIVQKLLRMDQLSRQGSWTKETLTLLKKYPGVGSKILAPKLGMDDHLKFKLNVRKLKNMGLTISLGTGYKLSPRGILILKNFKK